MIPDEVSRCEERMLQSDPGRVPSPMAGTDASLKRSVERAIWKDEVLRAIEYYEIDVRVTNGIVHLNGHIANMTSRIRIENAIRSIPGIQEVRNHLILDDKLTVEVAGALGTLEHTYGCKFFTGSSHGVISINGIVSHENVKLLAEICAAGNPGVRAVINHVRVAGAVGPELHDLPFLQPAIGETIYFLDGPAGVVKQVVINPKNRRVIAMLLLVNFTDPPPPVHSQNNATTRLAGQLVYVAMDAIRYLTKASGFLLINSHEHGRYQDFDSASFFAPGAEWTPPYPYCPSDVLFPVEQQTVDAQGTNVTNAYEELIEEDASFKEPYVVNDALGG
jgi:osmotically-inducible protein OsmY